MPPVARRGLGASRTYGGLLVTSTLETVNVEPLRAEEAQRMVDLIEPACDDELNGHGVKRPRE